MVLLADADVIELPAEVDDLVTAWNAVLAVVNDLSTLDEPTSLGVLST